MSYTQQMEQLGQINIFELEDESKEKEFIATKPAERKEHRVVRSKREVVYIKR